MIDLAKAMAGAADQALPTLPRAIGATPIPGPTIGVIRAAAIQAVVIQAVIGNRNFMTNWLATT